MLWKEPQTPTFKLWRERRVENAACETLGRLNGRNEAVMEQWDSLHSYMYTTKASVFINYVLPSLYFMFILCLL